MRHLHYRLNIFNFFNSVRNFPTIVMAKPLVVFVLGAPGSGKGTQCEKIVEVTVKYFGNE